MRAAPAARAWKWCDRRGVVTPDGSPVEAYAALPAEPDLSVVLQHVRGRKKILDLGAGAGRIADPLAGAGYDVLAVDESAEMLGHISRATPLQSRIEDFRSEERFDAVLLLSHLVNTAFDAHRQALLGTAASHVVADGIVVLQRLDPGRDFRPGRSMLGSVEVCLLDVDDSQWPVVSATTRCSVSGQSWDQPWQMTVLDDEATTRALQDHNLHALRMDGAWVVATPASDAR
ncbi:MAG TPA: methyltransferase domain-containing protein [Mycobacteriales bacterium]|nr:methyltransferase domain-containing protein [Mycobacteriales bacterium]